jgi:hypothetical protein
VPESGEISTTFGVFRSVCCGAEIVIKQGATFPTCPKHAHLPTVWTPVIDESDFNRSETPKPKKKNGGTPA